MKKKILVMTLGLIAAVAVGCGGGGGGSTTTVGNSTYAVATGTITTTTPMAEVTNIQIGGQTVYSGAGDTTVVLAPVAPSLAMNFATPITIAANAVFVAEVSASSTGISVAPFLVKFGTALTPGSTDKNWTDLFDTAPPVGTVVNAYTFAVLAGKTDLIPSGSTITVKIKQMDNFFKNGNVAITAPADLTLRFNTQ